MSKRFRISPRPTARGFRRAEFVDFYGVADSIQESSAETPCLWLGQNDPHKHPAFGTDLGCRMHLDRPRVRELIRVMQHWLDTGRLPRGRESSSG